MAVVAGNAGAGAAAAAAAAIINAGKASGVFVKIEPREFLRLLDRVEEPLVIHATFGIFTKWQRYVVSHRGFAFYCESPGVLELPARVEKVKAKAIWIPGT